MDRLTDDIQKTIRGLEALSERPSTASEAIDELLDQLYQLKIVLLGAPINTASSLYEQAARSMAAAAGKAERAGRDPSAAKALAAGAEEAIGRLAKLVDSMAHVP